MVFFLHSYCLDTNVSPELFNESIVYDIIRGTIYLIFLGHQANIFFFVNFGYILYMEVFNLTTNFIRKMQLNLKAPEAYQGRTIKEPDMLYLLGRRCYEYFYHQYCYVHNLYFLSLLKVLKYFFYPNFLNYTCINRLRYPMHVSETPAPCDYIYYIPRVTFC